MQASIRSLLEEELAEVRGGNEIVGLRVELVCAGAIVRIVSLPLIQTRLTILSASLFSNTE